MSASRDWLAGLGDRDPFTQLVPYPEFGVNSVHPEVIVAAFSEAFATVAGGQVRVVVGQLSDLIAHIPTQPMGRAVVFRFREC